jgi:hypothetical protein
VAVADPATVTPEQLGLAMTGAAEPQSGSVAEPQPGSPGGAHRAEGSSKGVAE